MITIMNCHEVWKWDQRPIAIKGGDLKMTMAMIFIMMAGTTLLFMRSIASPTQSCCHDADTASTSHNDAELTPDPPYKNG